MGNLAPSCIACNSRKSNKHLTEFDEWNWCLQWNGDVVNPKRCKNRAHSPSAVCAIDWDRDDDICSEGRTAVHNCPVDEDPSRAKSLQLTTSYGRSNELFYRARPSQYAGYYRTQQTPSEWTRMYPCHYVAPGEKDSSSHLFTGCCIFFLVVAVIIAAVWAYLSGKFQIPGVL